MAIKRKILTFKDFKKGKNTLENPEKHPIKESEVFEEGKVPTRDEMIVLLNKRFPNIWTKKSEEFYNDPKKNTGIWTGAEGSTFVDIHKKVPAFNVYDIGDKNYIDEVHKTLHKFLKDHGWYTESYDAGTFFFYPINNVAAESVTEAKKEKKEKAPEEASIFKRNILDFKKFKKNKDTVQDEKLKPVKESEEEFLTESDQPSDEMVKGNVYKIYDRKQNGKLIHRAARFDGPDGAKGNKFTLVNFPKEQTEWIKPADMESFYFSKTEWKPQEQYKKKK